LAGGRKKTCDASFSYLRPKLFRLLKASTLVPASQNGHSGFFVLRGAAGPVRRPSRRRDAALVASAAGR